VQISQQTSSSSILVGSLDAPAARERKTFVFCFFVAGEGLVWN
jgi:hypothetical protein